MYSHLQHFITIFWPLFRVRLELEVNSLKLSHSPVFQWFQDSRSYAVRSIANPVLLSQSTLPFITTPKALQIFHGFLSSNYSDFHMIGFMHFPARTVFLGLGSMLYCHRLSPVSLFDSKSWEKHLTGWWWLVGVALRFLWTDHSYSGAATLLKNNNNK